jgi:hypothetical protein
MMDQVKKDPKVYEKRQTLRDWHNTLYQLVAALELNCYASVDLGKSLLKRVGRLEKNILGLPDGAAKKTLAERISYLTETLGPPADLMAKAVEETGRRWDWITGGESAALVPTSKTSTKGPSLLTRGANESMRECKSVLTSPTFWKVVGAALGIAVIGTALILSRNSSSSYVPYEQSCTGRPDCRKCSTCSSCPYCKTPAFVTPCGVYFRSRMLR